MKSLILVLAVMTHGFNAFALTRAQVESMMVVPANVKVINIVAGQAQEDGSTTLIDDKGVIRFKVSPFNINGTYFSSYDEKGISFRGDIDYGVNMVQIVDSVKRGDGTNGKGCFPSILVNDNSNAHKELARGAVVGGFTGCPQR